MIRQVVLTEEEYAEIEKIKNEHTEMKERFNHLEKIKSDYIRFRKAVSKIFLDDDGNFSYYETTQHYPNHLHLNSDLIAELFNFYFEESFFKETGLKVDSRWKFKG